MELIVNENQNQNLTQFFKKESLEDFNESLPTDDNIIKYETNIKEEFDIKEESSNELSDNESDDEIDFHPKKSRKNSYTEDSIKWPEEDLTALISRIELALPDKDNLAYNTRVEKLNWDNVKFKEYTSEECKTTWLLIQKRLRRFRLLSEVLQDAKDWVLKPWTDYYRRKKTKNCPDMPRRPLTSYMLFYIKMKDEILAKNPDFDMPEVTKEISQIYRNLSSEERKKYAKMALSEKKNYEEKLDEFYRTHPEIPKKEEKPIDIKAKKPLTPFYLYYKDQIKNPDLDNNTFKEECKKQWKTLPDKEKLAWINLALDNEVKYQEDLKIYMTHNPDFTPTVLKPILTKEEKSLKERLAGKPVKPPTSAYSLFTAMMLQSEGIKKIAPKERMKAVADEWKDASDEEKKPFQKRVNELMKQYKEDLALYLKSLPEYKQQEEAAQNVSKRKLKNVDKIEKVPEKKKKSNEEEINLDTSITTESPLQVSQKSNNSTEEEEENFYKIIKTEPSEPSLEVPDEEKMDSNEEYDLNKIIKTEPPPEISEKKKKSNKQANLDNIIKVEPPQPPLSGFDLFTSIYKGSIPIKSAWRKLNKHRKEDYEQQVKKMKEEYIVEYENFLKSLSKEELLAFSQQKQNNDNNDVSVEVKDSSESDDSDSETE